MKSMDSLGIGGIVGRGEQTEETSIEHKSKALGPDSASASRLTSSRCLVPLAAADRLLASAPEAALSIAASDRPTLNNLPVTEEAEGNLGGTAGTAVPSPQSLVAMKRMGPAEELGAEVMAKQQLQQPRPITLKIVLVLPVHEQEAAQNLLAQLKEQSHGAEMIELTQEGKARAGVGKPSSDCSTAVLSNASRLSSRVGSCGSGSTAPDNEPRADQSHCATGHGHALSTTHAEILHNLQSNAQADSSPCPAQVIVWTPDTKLAPQSPQPSQLSQPSNLCQPTEPSNPTIPSQYSPRRQSSATRDCDIQACVDENNPSSRESSSSISSVAHKHSSDCQGSLIGSHRPIGSSKEDQILRHHLAATLEVSFDGVLQFCQESAKQAKVLTRRKGPKHSGGPADNNGDGFGCISTADTPIVDEASFGNGTSASTGGRSDAPMCSQSQLRTQMQVESVDRVDDSQRHEAMADSAASAVPVGAGRIVAAAVNKSKALEVTVIVLLTEGASVTLRRYQRLPKNTIIIGQ